MTRAPAAVSPNARSSCPSSGSAGTGSGTVTCTDAEQLLVMSDSSATASTHAP